MPEDIETLSRDEVVRVRKALEELRPHYVERGEKLGCFFTLGAASYIDSRGDAPGSYRERLHAQNPLLLRHFGWLYDVVTDRLEEAFGGPVGFDPQLALPGFHLWFHPCIFVRPNASVHFDLQHRLLRWPGRERADFDRLFTFTLPIQLPAGGGGLNTWNISLADYQAFAQRGAVTSVDDVTRLTAVDMVYHPYNVGTLVLSRGTMLHQIAPVLHSAPGDARITLQGHGLWCDGRWLVYW